MVADGRVAVNVCFFGKRPVGGDARGSRGGGHKRCSGRLEIMDKNSTIVSAYALLFTLATGLLAEDVLQNAEEDYPEDTAPRSLFAARAPVNTATEGEASTL